MTMKIKDVCAYVNSQPKLISLLYDLDLLPEQLDFDRPHEKERTMLIIVDHWFENEKAIRNAHPSPSNTPPNPSPLPESMEAPSRPTPPRLRTRAKQ